MKSVKNKGMKMTESDVQALIDAKKERLAKQQGRRDKLDQTMTNTSNDIEQLEYTLHQMKLSRVKPRRIIPNKKISEFITQLCLDFERIQHRLHRTLNYAWFCLAFCARYSMENRNPNSTRPYLSPTTVLGYFKRERGTL